MRATHTHKQKQTPTNLAVVLARLDGEEERGDGGGAEEDGHEEGLRDDRRDKVEAAKGVQRQRDDEERIDQRAEHLWGLFLFACVWKGKGERVLRGTARRRGGPDDGGDGGSATWRRLSASSRANCDVEEAKPSTDAVAALLTLRQRNRGVRARRKHTGARCACMHWSQYSNWSQY